MGYCDTDAVKMSLDPAADTAVCGPSHPVSLDTGNVLPSSPKGEIPRSTLEPSALECLAPVHGTGVDSLSPHSWCIQHSIKRCLTRRMKVQHGQGWKWCGSGLGKIEWDAL